MLTIPAPSLVLSREEWPDADFDLPEGEPIHAPGKYDDEEDWDLEMDFGKTGGAKVKAAVTDMVTSEPSSTPSGLQPQVFTIRPPLPLFDIDDDDNDEGVSTIKAAVLPVPISKITQPPVDDDFEDAFVLPSDLTQLSLAPLSLSHRSSKHSLEWGDKDHTSSSQSSDAYSSLGFADASPSSNSASSVSLPETETEEDEEDDELEGLVIPSALFESGQSGRQLTKILEMKKKAQFTSNLVKVTTPDPEDDFEIGLIIDDDVDLSPSRLLNNTHQHSRRHFNRSKSLPQQRPSSLRPPSRISRAKSPLNPPTSSARQLQKIRLSPPPPLRPPTHSQTFQALSSSRSPAPQTPVSFLSPKPGSLRGQKSYSGLKPPTPPSTTRKLTRKASLSSLIEASQSQASGSGSGGSRTARYEEPTAASRAKTHKNSTSHLSELKVSPTRPSTPSSNSAALRLTMPTQSRLKTRPPLSAVFAAPTTPGSQSPIFRAISPLPPRPPSNQSTKLNRVPSNPQPTVAKVLRRPKRQRTYGDGTELDGIDDLPTDRDKECRFRVQPKGHGNRIPGAYFPSKPHENGTMRKTGRREGSNGSPETAAAVTGSVHVVNTLRRTTARIEFPAKPSSPNGGHSKKKKNVSSPIPPNTRRKPTLIRNLGGTGAPKVVGDMKWNPLTLRWEGNDHVLRDFDAVVGTSTRPALITHLTGSSIGSPVGSFASGARIVGNMIFDSSRMCWISTLPPDEDEPDVFANLADDEEDGEGWETKGGTIRASLQQHLGSEIGSANISTATASAHFNTPTQVETPSPARSRTRTLSESESDRGTRAPMIPDVDEAFLESCKNAEERHHLELKGWKSALANQDAFIGPDRSHLYEIRALATRKY